MSNVPSAASGKLKEPAAAAKSAAAPKAAAAAVSIPTRVAPARPAAPSPKPAPPKAAPPKAVPPKPVPPKAVPPKPVPPKAAAPNPTPPVKRAEQKTAETSADERASALAFIGSLATEVSKGTVNLPCFPDVVMRIRKALGAPDVSMTEIVKIVGTEPRLSARLLQAANSAAFNPTGKHLTDLRAAITRLGHRQVQGAAMSFAVKQLRLAPSFQSIFKTLQILWEKKNAGAGICQAIAKSTRISPDEAFLDRKSV